MLYRLIRTLLFLLPAEASHDLALKLMAWGHSLGLLEHVFKPPQLSSASIPGTTSTTTSTTTSITVMGLEFSNPVGLAAGLDKNGDYIDALAALGFGFIEIGTVTPRPQPGNPKPRLFRLAAHQAIINRMGFNNKGVDYLLERVRESRYQGVLGINIGKNVDTPVEQALDDYLICLRKVYPHAGYIVVNISSPNTPGLRSLQLGQPLRDLLAGIKQAQVELTAEHGLYRPIAIKIAPDMADEDLESVASALLEFKLDAVIATNTTLSREVPGLVAGSKEAALLEEAGGMSGQPLTVKANQTLAKLISHLDGQIPVIGVGGIMSADDAQAKFDAGASLVQVYSGFIYQGPQLIKDIVFGLQGVRR